MNEEKKRILQMVQDGKLSTDEALKILEELDQASKESEKKEQVLVNELSTVVLDKEGTDKQQDYFNKKISSSKEKIFDFVESAVKKIKESDLDLNFGTSHEISHIFTHDQTPLKEIEIDIANGKTKVIPWSNNEIRIECQAKVYRGAMQDEAREALLKEVHFLVEDEKLRFHLLQKFIKADVTLYIPNKEYEEVYIRMFNGSISGESLKADHFKVKTANGKIAIEDVTGKKLNAETGNGNISIRQATIEKIETETLNGSIHVDGIYKNLDAQSFSGQVTCRVDEQNCEYISAKTVTGKLDVILPTGMSVEGELKSNLGNFNVNLDGIQIIEEKNDVIQKVLRFKTTKDVVPVLHLFADTKTGGISVS
ncbi:DUF4097 family beta strand repeat-containing protein [Bacillus cihuensis]|uniref:DUF4097 family beta strand repeat-containing protein n=1 Tax=Bacillus cihuensis TaxID=1208599 RepID=UPI00040C48A4|nr:DUF4097 domain-containing protein [Bacillus cihuensis]